MIMQVEFVSMDKDHDDAYKEAIQEYRAVSQARMPKGSDINSKNVAQVLPRRQISNYFVQFRKVRSAADHVFITIFFVSACCLLILYATFSLRLLGMRGWVLK